MNLEFILRAFGFTPADSVRLKAMLDPAVIAATTEDLRARFEAMERRNMDMHRMIVRMYTAALRADPTNSIYERHVMLALEETQNGESGDHHNRDTGTGSGDGNDGTKPH